MCHPPLRVAFCHYTSDVCGGSDRSLLDFVLSLDRDVFTPFMILRTGDPLTERYRNAGCTVAEIPFVPPRRALEWGKLARFFLAYGPHVFETSRLLRRWKIDVVHVNTINNLQCPVAARLAGCLLVWHVREMTGDSRIGRAMRAMVARIAHLVMTCSDAVSVTLSACGDRVHTVYDGIDLSEYPDPGGLDRERAPIIACIGRLEHWKGQHVLVEALADVFREHPEARAWIVGGSAVNKPAYLPALQRRCSELDIAARVEFMGIRHDIPDLLQQAALLVLPSVTPEPFGRTVVEAMAASCPPVATGAGGPLESIEHGVSGLLVTPDDAGALAGAINLLLDDPALARRLGCAGRQRALAHFSLETMSATMSALLNQAAGRQSE